MKNVCLELGFVVAMAGFLTYCSPDRVAQNVQNSQRLKVGMMLEEALDIMGEPYEIKDHVHSPGVFDYYYESPFGASDWIFFTVNPVKRVVDITPYPELPTAFEPAIADLGGGYRMSFADISNGGETLLDDSDSVIIKGPVLDYAVDARYIDVVALPYDSIPKGRSEFVESAARQYWILSKEDNKVMGPLTKARYQGLKDSLGIGSSVTLRLQ